MEGTELRKYQEKVFDFCDRIETGSQYKITNLCKSDNRQLFIYSIIEYMKMTRIRFSNGIVFNKDMTIVKKTSIPNVKLEPIDLSKN